MPGFDGTGPLGQGPRTGGGFGRCNSEDFQPTGRAMGRGFRGGCRGGRGMGRGAGRGIGMEQMAGAPVNDSEALSLRLARLEAEAADIRQRLGKMSGE